MNVCIVGAGIFGMAAALELRHRGHDVTLIERGEIPNPEASSTDVSKVIRRTMYPNETYVELVTRAAAQWRKWHDRTSRSIYFQKRQADRRARSGIGSRGPRGLGDPEPDDDGGL